METQVDPAALEILSRTPTLLREFAEGTAPIPRVDGEWGLHEVIAHVLDVHDVGFMTRVRRIVEEDDPYIESIDPPARLREGGLLERDTAWLSGELARRRRDDLAWIRGLSAGQLARSGTHDVAGTLYAADIVNYMAFHDLIHLKQAATAVQDHLKSRMGQTRKFVEDV